MTVLFLGPPTRGPVMDFCESCKKKKSRSQPPPLLFLSPPSSHVDSAAARSHRIMQRPASRIANQPMADKFQHNAAADWLRHLDQSDECSCHACTQRHMARPRYPRERERGSGTVLLCQTASSEMPLTSI